MLLFLENHLVYVVKHFVTASLVDISTLLIMYSNVTYTQLLGRLPTEALFVL